MRHILANGCFWTIVLFFLICFIGPPLLNGCASAIEAIGGHHHGSIYDVDG